MRALPARLRPDHAEGWRSRLHFRFPGDAAPEWTVVVDGASCTVAEGLAGDADCTVSAAPATFMAIATGRQNPQTAFLLGRVKVSSVGEMLRFMKVFPPLHAG
jgi:putative sterol carrier protein